MTLELALLIAIAVGIAIATAISQAAVAATSLVPPQRVHRLVENDVHSAAYLDELVSRRSRLRSAAALLVGLSSAATVLALVASVRAAVPGLAAWAVVVSGGLVGWLLEFSLVLGLPRAFAVANPERVALASARFAVVVTRLLGPVARLLVAPWKWAFGIVRGEDLPSPWSTGDEFFTSSAHDEETGREETEEALFEAVSDFSERVVREVMVPRTDMASLEDTASAAEAIELVRTTGYSRLPVYHETIDDVRGILYAKDLLAAMSNDGGHEIASIARSPVFVPETKPANEMLIEMRGSRTHIAIVADEYGGTAGLVTIEDLIEEIVGEIFDEYDLEVAMVEEIGEGRIRVDARMPVDDLNERFGTAIEIESADTVGGLFTALAGRIPSVGESVEIEGLRLIAAGLEGTRILHVIVEPAAAPAEEGTSDA